MLELIGAETGLTPLTLLNAKSLFCNLDIVAKLQKKGLPLGTNHHWFLNTSYYETSPESNHNSHPTSDLQKVGT